ncbi:hypothetical protein CGK74_11325 [Thauera propionica]|jgi:hypothetical protein|uniref:Uncharacterized protein n=1 Tax=Thauera propionica TaxID=2019431 RepID=A0A235EXQ2_9RHOO|nr:MULTISPECIES: hypothetical protein [Thauera]MDD3675350.1 hypothetical protein [Thauera propionica]MDI3489886.1 hypothetical protein [Thauera sp.]OYD53794.1 hypothetical protein CGK74_11325 [Thauera propionica]
MALTRLRPVVLAAVLSLTATACVTINIYFPAAAAEKAADRIIDEVWQMREAQTPPAASTQEGEKQ